MREYYNISYCALGDGEVRDIINRPDCALCIGQFRGTAMYHLPELIYLAQFLTDHRIVGVGYLVMSDGTVRGWDSDSKDWNLIWAHTFPNSAPTVWESFEAFEAVIDPEEEEIE